MSDLTQVFSCGGGTQSSAIASLIIRGELPKPDFALIADTGYERGSTWQYMDSVLSPRLKEAGVELIRVPASKYAYEHDGLFNKAGTLLMPTFTTQNEGAVGKLSNFCTSYWKRDVCENFLRREHGIVKTTCRKWIGFSIDEMRRAVRMMSGQDFKAGRIFFPLIDRRLRRQQSVSIVQSMGWPPAPRSACYHCPNQADDEWRSLTAEEFEMAVTLEREARLRDPDIYFHSSCVPLDQVKFSDKKSGGCDSGECFL